MENILSKKVNVKNRGTGSVGYTIAESGIRREFVPGEIKKNISVDELEKLTYIPGGKKLIDKYLLINDEEVVEYLELTVEPEYYYDEASVKTLLTTGTLDQLLDCLDFAPGGVLDLVKKTAVQIKLNDVAKRHAIKDKLKFDVTAALSNIEFANSKEEKEESTAKRRTAPLTKDSAPEKTGRRTAPVAPAYNRVEN